jgi:hypothetical protein
MNDENHQQKPPLSPAYQAEPFDHPPRRAALCAIIPGIGAVYNREYIKAIVHFSVFAGLVILAEAEGVFALAAFSFYVFTVIDAYRSAETIAKQDTLVVQSQVEKTEEINFPLWGGILILMGLLFLLDNLDVIRLSSFVDFWPLILIALGAYLIWSYFQPPNRERPAASSPESSGPPQPGSPNQSASDSEQERH